MATVRPTTHATDEPVTVFLIGMTINKPWRVHRWLPLFLAMPAMLSELLGNKAAVDRGDNVDDLGLLAAYTTISTKGPVTVQYWRSPEHLYRYANGKTHQHLPRQQAYFKRAGHLDDSVGIWHETFVVEPDAMESLYHQSPLMGLAKATTSIPATGQHRRHARRVRSERTEAVVSE